MGAYVRDGAQVRRISAGLYVRRLYGRYIRNVDGARRRRYDPRGLDRRVDGGSADRHDRGIRVRGGAGDRMHPGGGISARGVRARYVLSVPDDLAGPVAFLTSDDAAFITGQSVVVDGGAYKIS